MRKLTDILVPVLVLAILGMTIFVTFGMISYLE